MWNQAKLIQLSKLESLLKLAEANYCRYPVLLNNEHTHSFQLLESFLSKQETEKIAWVSEKTPEFHQNLQHLKAVNVIGREYQFIVYEINNEFDPNLFTALCGTLRGGGLLFILAPSIPTWLTTCQSNNDWFMWRLISKLSESDLITQATLDSDELNINTNQLGFTNLESTEQSYDQQKLAIQEIIHVVKGHRNRPLVLLADRGRGKSAALGIATSKLLKDNLKNIIITAPSLEACSIIFKHIKLELPHATHQPGKVELENSQILFIAPDKLIASEIKTDLLVIDEAAGIPPPTLEQLLNKYSRIVFASTVHGYEGSGHCFSIKFFKYLDKLTPSWRKFHLDSPLRWSRSDPLEKLINQLFLLKPEKNILLENVNLNEIRIELISTQELIENESLLSEFYELLSSAHYKTQPSDLKQIVNNPDINIYVVKQKSILVSAAFTIREGELEPEISEQIYQGNRRPKGHLVPQSLLMHLGIKDAGQLSYLRIMRIAVRPEIQSCGIGSLLLEHIKTDAKNQMFDFLSCSYGANKELLNFWNKHDFALVRIGHHKKSLISAHAALMIQPLSTAAKVIHKQALTHFSQNFRYLLKEILNELDPDISLKIYKDFMPQPATPPSNNDWPILQSFAKHNRTYEDNISLINLFSHYALCQDNTHSELHEKELKLIILKTIYAKSWQDIVKELKLSGKNQAITEFKKNISKLMCLHQPIHN